MPSPFVFDEFFASGKEESISPFLKPSARRWAKNVKLKSALLAAACLLGAFISSFFHKELSNFLLLFVYFFSGTPALINTIEDIAELEINIDVLMTLAALLSIVIDSALEGGLLLVLFELSGAMENTVMNKTKNTLYSLHNLAPKKAFVILEDGSLRERSIREITTGSLILVKAGEVIPLDGIITHGGSSLNLMHLTGESIPTPKKEGDEVPAGALNIEGGLTIRVTRISSESTLSRIIGLVTEAAASKPRLENFLDRFGKAYAMTIIGLFILFALSFPYLLHIPFLGNEGSIYRALTFLITASPCALIIGAPTAYLSAISACAKRGILLKGGYTLDAVNTCHCIAFDKTGTLTTGALEVLSFAPILGSMDPNTALQIAASLEKNAVHPIAKAILKKAEQENLPFIPITDFEAKPGLGLIGHILIDNKKVICAIGHDTLMNTLLVGPKKGDFEAIKRTLKEEIATFSFLLVGDCLFAFHFQDTIRSQAKTTIENLKKEKKKVVMLTGDHQKSAEFIGNSLGIPFIYSNLRPEDKLDIITVLTKEEGVIMIGDGINDAPALTRASVGISMGKIGSASAIEASDIVFLHDDLSLLNFLLKKAKQTASIVKENLVLALSVIVLASTPALLGFIPLWLAVILHEGGTVIVALNSLRLLKVRD